MTARVTFSDMERFALNEAARIDVIQKELIRVGDRTAPDPGQLRNKEICEGILRLIDACKSDPIIAERLKAAAAARASA